MVRSEVESFLSFLVFAKYRKYKPELNISKTIETVRKISINTIKLFTPSAMYSNIKKA